MDRRKRIISAVLVLAFLLHGAPLLQEFRGQRQTTWPFMAWGMYRHAHPAGEPIRTVDKDIAGVTAGGQVLPLEPLRWPQFFNFFNLFRGPEARPSHTGLPYYTLQQNFFQPMAAGDTAAARRLAARLNPQRSDPFVEFVVSQRVYTLTPSGVQEEDLPPIRYRVAEAGGR